jgi:hypothetical protein
VGSVSYEVPRLQILAAFSSALLDPINGEFKRESSTYVYTHLSKELQRLTAATEAAAHIHTPTGKPGSELTAG